MDKYGQVYFDDEDRIPIKDKKRLEKYEREEQEARTKERLERIMKEDQSLLERLRDS